MTYPAILLLEDFRDTQRRAEIRQRLHDRFDCWLKQREDGMQDQPPTLAELTQAVFALRPVQAAGVIPEEQVRHAGGWGALDLDAGARPVPVGGGALG